ncbi:biotin/lipoyl-containing protein, partial [Alcanivorax sp. HI0044]|uniref:biotin/lipoyl-containing protein n=4 Tax=unclassified Alcanivorax TaxID=2638842 RepID=UPI000A85ABE1
RVDAGYEQGDRVDEHYDPMIAKLICHGEDRNAARQQLIQALDALELEGIHHNAAFLRRVLNDEAFAGAELDTRLLEHRPHLLEATAVDPALLALAAARLQAHKATGDSPWQSLNGWRPLNQRLRQTRVEANGEQFTVREDGQQTAIGDRQAAVSFAVTTADQDFSLHWGTDSLAARFAWQNTHTVVLFVGGQAYPVTLNPSRDTARHADAGGFSAPMSGTIVALHTAPGDSVEAGDAVITLEAMKMEHTLRATVPGTVNGFAVAAGDSVSEGTVLVEFTAADSHADTDSKGETE